jgi:hypothetical protein
MKNTYIVTAKSCENPNITIEYEGLCEECIEECIEELTTAFRSVEVICEQTGEVVYTHYVGADWFTPFASYGEVIDEVYDIVSCCDGEDEDDDEEDLQLHFTIEE